MNNENNIENNFENQETISQEEIVQPTPLVDPTTSIEQSIETITNNEPEKKPKKKSKLVLIIIIVLAIVLIAVIALVIFNPINNKNDNNNTNEKKTTTTTVATTSTTVSYTCSTDHLKACTRDELAQMGFEKISLDSSNLVANKINLVKMKEIKEVKGTVDRLSYEYYNNTLTITSIYTNENYKFENVLKVETESIDCSGTSVFVLYYSDHIEVINFGLDDELKIRLKENVTVTENTQMYYYSLYSTCGIEPVYILYNDGKYKYKEKYLTEDDLNSKIAYLDNTYLIYSDGNAYSSNKEFKVKSFYTEPIADRLDLYVDSDNKFDSKLILDIYINKEKYFNNAVIFYENNEVEVKSLK